MKNLKKLFTALLLLCAVTVSAHDFEVDGIYYYVTDEVNKTVEVTYKGSDYDSYTNEYSGDVVIPETVTYDNVTYNVTSIGDYAFYECSGLTSIEIPNSVTTIGVGAFEDCTGLTSIEIPNSVTSIGSSAFYGCSGLTSVTIGSGVTGIRDSAFCGCSGLTSIEIPNSVTSIGSSAFSYCTGLTSIVIPNSVTTIGHYAFSDCTGLTSIEIPNSVTSIGDLAFENCTGLTSITSLIPAENLFVPGSNAFSGIDMANCTLYVPYGAKETYATTDGWSDFENIVELEETNGIEGVAVEKTAPEAVYDLNGRRVENPASGIYIIGGKKVLVK